LIAAAWLGAVAAAAIFGVTTVSALGAGSGPSGALSQQEVNDRLAQAGATSTTPATTSPSATAQPSGTPSASAQPSPTRRYFTTSGGSLWASCTGAAASIETISPRQGYRIDNSDKGPGSSAYVKFRQEVDRGHGNEYRVTVTCAQGVPQISEEADR